MRAKPIDEHHSQDEAEVSHITSFRLEGLDCADCAKKLETMLCRVEEVYEANVNFGAGLLTVHHRSEPGLVRHIQSLAAQAGYRAYPAGYPISESVAGSRRPFRVSKRELAILLCGSLILAGIALNMFGTREMYATLAFAAAILVGGWRMARAGWVTVRLTRRLDMNVLMTVAVAGAALIGEWTEGAVVVLLFALGNWLESRTMERARRSIQQLMRISPRTATRLRRAQTGLDTIHQDRYSALKEGVPIEELQIGDVILVRPGERLPMDGRILSGHSSVNQAPITGESLPVTKEAGENVFAGTINGEGALEVLVCRSAEDNTISRIVHMVEQAQAQRAPMQRLVDRFSSIYTPTVIVLAAAVAVLPPLLYGAPFTDWLYRALVLLVISCPCALVISTPVTIVSALTNAARQGILIKGGAYLEAAGSLRAVALDKTGTLTQGEPRVTDIISLNGYPAQELLAIAAAVEEPSEHALARAIVHEAQHRDVPQLRAEGFQALAGQGARARVGDHTYLIGSPRLLRELGIRDDGAREAIHHLEAQGCSIALLVRLEASEARYSPESDVIGAFGLADRVRPGAREALRRLKEAGIDDIIMLTGDNARTARAVASKVGVEEFMSDLLPEHKVEVVEALLKKHGRVAMVGDGVNDAPALARASLGIAMGAAGTDVALETADIALMSDDLNKLASTVRLSRRTRQVIVQNIVLSLGLKGLFLGLALAGVATLWMAVFADMGASLLVTFNGMRLLRTKV